MAAKKEMQSTSLTFFFNTDEYVMIKGSNIKAL